MRRKVKIKAFILGVGLICLTSIGLQVKATPIRSYGTKVGGVYSFYAWTGTDNGHWCDVIMKVWDGNNMAVIGDAATAESYNGWAQTPTTFVGFNLGAKSFHYTVDDYNSSVNIWP